MGRCSAGDGALSMQSGSGRPFEQKEGYAGLFIAARFAVPQKRTVSSLHEGGGSINRWFHDI